MTQNLSSQGSYGHVQTLNEPHRGPSFCFGSDIFVGDMHRGYTVNLSYGGTEFVNDIRAGDEPSREPVTFGKIEVFTITPVPEPTTSIAACMLAIGALAVTGPRRPRRRGTT